jgi:hypothetical protein
VRGSLTPALILDGLCLHVLSSFQRTGTPGKPRRDRVSPPGRNRQGKTLRIYDSRPFPVKLATTFSAVTKLLASHGALSPPTQSSKLEGPSPANRLSPNEFQEGRRKRSTGGSCLDFLEYVPLPGLSTPPRDAASKSFIYIDLLAVS